MFANHISNEALVLKQEEFLKFNSKKIKQTNQRMSERYEQYFIEKDTQKYLISLAMRKCKLKPQ